MARAPVGHVEPRWLSLRGPADARARSAAGAVLAAELARDLTSRELPAVRLVDVGAGTGAGASWVRSRLPARQEWRLLDQDLGLLEIAPPVRAGWARAVVADVGELSRLLDEQPAEAVTCQALLDILTPDQVDDLLSAAAACDADVLLGLNVTGEVTLTPDDPDDALVTTAFNAHQRRGGRLGPGAAAHARRRLEDHGYAVTTAATPWRLGPSDTALVRAWLHGYARAASEQLPDRADLIHRWHGRRDRAARDGDLRVVVGHVDVLGLARATGTAAS